MANRSTLHRNHLQSFSDWLVADGWALEAPKGDYEIIRARKGKRLLIGYERHDRPHITVEDRHMGVIAAFLKQNRAAKGGIASGQTQAGESAV